MSHEKTVLHALYQLAWAQIHLNNFAGHPSVEDGSLRLAEIYAKEALRIIRDLKDVDGET